MASYGVVWLSPIDCDNALEVFAEFHFSHGAGILDVLIGQTALTIDIPLHTFNQKHYRFIPGLQTVQPYRKVGLKTIRHFEYLSTSLCNVSTRRA